MTQHTTYCLKRIKRIRTNTGHAQYLYECYSRPVGYLARVQVEDIPSPYAYSPSIRILRHKAQHKEVVIFETSHRCFDVFEVPVEFLRFKSEREAEDWHMRYGKHASA